MSHRCCLAGIHADKLALFRAVLEGAGEPDAPSLARLDVGELGRLNPELIICDIDHESADPFELVRQLRFVLPSCIIAVQTTFLDRPWALACNLAGVNCLLLEDSSETDLSAGIRAAMQVGCFTDPRFATA